MFASSGARRAAASRCSAAGAGLAAREQDLAEDVTRVRVVRLGLEDRAQQRQRLLRAAFEVEHRGQVMLGLEVAGMAPQLRAQGLLRLRQLALLEVDDAEGRVGVGHVGLGARALSAGTARPNRSRPAARRPGPGPRPAPAIRRGWPAAGRTPACASAAWLLRTRARPYAYSSDASAARARVVAQERRRLVVGLGVEPGHGQHPPQAAVLRALGERAREGPRGLLVFARVEAGDAQRILDLREVGRDLGREREVLGRPREPLVLRLHHAQVQVGARERRLHALAQGGPLRRAEPGQGHGQEGIGVRRRARSSGSSLR